MQQRVMSSAVNPRPSALIRTPTISTSHAATRVLEMFKNATGNFTLNTAKAIAYHFPTDQQSRSNPEGPVLAGQDFLNLRKDTDIELRQGTDILSGLNDRFHTVLHGYGLEMVDNEINVTIGEEKFPGEPFDLGSLHRRQIARIVRSMSLFGKTKEANALFAFLQKVAGELPAPERRTYDRSMSH
jgi:hypothetical protein